MTDAELAAKRQQRKASYYRHRAAILARRRERYRNDPKYQLNMKMRARLWRNAPARALKLKKRRADYYAAHVDEAKARAREWNEKNRERYLRREAERRARNRESNRAKARLESSLITDSYVRNQLSKYSTKSTHEWTAQEVTDKRLMIIQNRAKRITAETAKEIRELYSKGGFSADELAARFHISVSNVFMIVNNKTHHDPTWRFEPIRNVTAVKRVLTLINSSAELTKLYGNK